MIQARLASTRLPGKVLRDLAGRPTLGWVLRAAEQAVAIDDVVVATSSDASDDRLAAWCEREGVAVHRGPSDDVLSRFVGAIAARPQPGSVVRLTADCPLLDPALIDAAVAAHHHSGVDYLSTIAPRSLPRGLDIEVLTREALMRADREAAGVDRVHVTSWLYREHGRATIGGLHFAPPSDDLRVTLDTRADARMLDALVAVLGDRQPTFRETVAALREHPDIAAINADVAQKRIEEG